MSRRAGDGGMTVVEIDFGDGRRDAAARRLAALLALDALHETNIRDNPVPYLERASERIDQLEKLIFEASLAARPAWPTSTAVAVDVAEYAALLRCRAMLEDAAERLASEER